MERYIHLYWENTGKLRNKLIHIYIISLLLPHFSTGFIIFSSLSQLHATVKNKFDEVELKKLTSY